MFQQADRYSGNMTETRPYYSAEYKLQGHKMEASVLPDGIRVSLSGHENGGESDIAIFIHRIRKHITLFQK